MITASATEVQNDFEKYLQMVQSGDEIAITSNGKEVARLVPYMKLDDLPDSKAVRAMKSASHIAEKNGIAGMTSEDINAQMEFSSGKCHSVSTSKRQPPKNQGFVGTLHPYQKKIHSERRLQ